MDTLETRALDSCESNLLRLRDLGASAEDIWIKTPKWINELIYILFSYDFFAVSLTSAIVFQHDKRMNRESTGSHELLISLCDLCQSTTTLLKLPYALQLSERRTRSTMAELDFCAIETYAKLYAAILASLET